MEASTKNRITTSSNANILKCFTKKERVYDRETCQSFRSAVESGSATTKTVNGPDLLCLMKKTCMQTLITMKSFEFSSGEIKAAIDDVLQECHLLPARVDTIRQYLQQIVYGDSKFDPDDVIHSTVDAKYLHSLMASFRNALVSNLRKRLNSVGIVENRFEQGNVDRLEFERKG
ncbi:hypothetical protein DdX_10792 [Ditylenchus destructor]|uniref:Uncharacterized protein n=1 Tax=Ditylenchus destructor TaxID=166010 RepID=A0AAD4N391_9BILA|nr:hypothetical protein DdX_10792 [Ditylenchus destructor]